MSHPIRRLHDLAECCVFGKQSVDPFHCDLLHFEQSSKAGNPKLQAPGSKQKSVWDLDFGFWNFLHFTCAKCRRHPFFRSYGARLPSSLTRFHSRALAHLCPPTCVGFRYGQPWKHLVAFLDTSFNRSASAEASTSLLLRADRHFQSTACLYSCVTTKLNHSRCRNIKPAVHRLRPSAST